MKQATSDGAAIPDKREPRERNFRAPWKVNAHGSVYGALVYIPKVLFLERGDVVVKQLADVADLKQLVKSLARLVLSIPPGSWGAMTQYGSKLLCWGDTIDDVYDHAIAASEPNPLLVFAMHSDDRLY